MSTCHVDVIMSETRYETGNTKFKTALTMKDKTKSNSNGGKNHFRFFRDRFCGNSYSLFLYDAVYAEIIHLPNLFW